MVNKPDILFADEPCANLDTENSRMVLDLFQRDQRSDAADHRHGIPRGLAQGVFPPHCPAEGWQDCQRRDKRIIKKGCLMQHPYLFSSPVRHYSENRSRHGRNSRLKKLSAPVAGQLRLKLPRMQPSSSGPRTAFQHACIDEMIQEKRCVDTAEIRRDEATSGFTMP